MSGEQPTAVAQRLVDLADRFPERPILSSMQDGKWVTRTAAELFSRVCATAAAAAVAGLLPPARALIRLPNGEDLVRAVLACWWLGCTPMIASPGSTEREMAVLFEGTDTGAGADKVIDLTADAVRSDTGQQPPQPAPEPEVGWFLPSGGTTGLPRFVPVLRTPALAMTLMVNVMRRANWHPDVVQLSAGPMFHAGPFTTALAGLSAGAHLVIVPRFTPALLTSAVRLFAPGWCLLTPYQMALIEANGPLTAAISACLDGLLHTSAPCPADLKRRWIDRLGAHRVFEVYGATQMVGGAFCAGVDWLTRPGTVGEPFTDLMIVDEDGHPVPPGVVGEIYIRAGLSDAYPGSTHLRTLPGGHYSLGDLGYVDDDGFLYLTDRIDDVIQVGGAKVSAREVENVLLSHPRVADVVVGRRRHDLLGNVVYAAVVPVDRTEPPTPDQLQTFCRSRLADYKVPAICEIVDALSRSQAGKVERFRYR